MSVPLLTDSAIALLCEAAEACCFRTENSVVGKRDAIVRQDYSSCAEFPDDSIFIKCMNDLQRCLDDAFSRLEHYPFSTRQQFNSAVLQRYYPGKLGITPHRDSLRAIHLICLFNLSGKAKFCCCSDRQGNNAIELDTTPGHVIFMRGTGFLNSEERPFHFLTNIQETRYSLGLRQRILKS